MTKTMKITDILRTANSSCDFSSFDGSPGAWMLMIQSKASDSGFQRLVDSILENGWEEGSAIGWRDGYICEGHHRLAAAILLGLDEIPVSSWGDDTWHIDAHFDEAFIGVPFFDFFSEDDGMIKDMCPCGCGTA